MTLRKLTLLEWLDIPLGVLQAVTGTVIAFFLAPFRGPNTPKSLKRHLLLTISRKSLSRLSPEQLQNIAGTTETNYVAWMKSHSHTPQTIYLEDIDTKAFWIGSPSADNVLLYFHGGGFAMPANDGHIGFAASLIPKAQEAGKSVAVLLLQYDLAPERKYPRQLQQAVELLRYTIVALKKTPEQIMIGGDSAGGNMVFGVLSHLMKAHPSIDPLELSGPLRGVLVSSPVTVLNTNNPGFRTQEAQDPAAADTIRIWLSNLLGSSEPDAWNQPLSNDTSWWSGLSNVVQGILMTVASAEMMAEDTIALATKIKSTYSDLTLFSSSVDFHAQPGIGPALGLEFGEAAGVRTSWAIERLQS